MKTWSMYSSTFHVLLEFGRPCSNFFARNCSQDHQRGDVRFGDDIERGTRLCGLHDTGAQASGKTHLMEEICRVPTSQSASREVTLEGGFTGWRDASRGGFSRWKSNTRWSTSLIASFKDFHLITEKNTLRYSHTCYLKGT